MGSSDQPKVPSHLFRTSAADYTLKKKKKKKVDKFFVALLRKLSNSFVSFLHCDIQNL